MLNIKDIKQMIEYCRTPMCFPNAIRNRDIAVKCQNPEGKSDLAIAVRSGKVDARDVGWVYSTADPDKVEWIAKWQVADVKEKIANSDLEIDKIKLWFVPMHNYSEHFGIPSNRALPCEVKSDAKS